MSGEMAASVQRERRYRPQRKELEEEDGADERRRGCIGGRRNNCDCIYVLIGYSNAIYVYLVVNLKE